jgi:hypothetical protein
MGRKAVAAYRAPALGVDLERGRMRPKVRPTRLSPWTPRKGGPFIPGGCPSRTGNSPHSHHIRPARPLWVRGRLERLGEDPAATPARSSRRTDQSAWRVHPANEWNPSTMNASDGGDCFQSAVTLLVLGVAPLPVGASSPVPPKSVGACSHALAHHPPLTRLATSVARDKRQGARRPAPPHYRRPGAEPPRGFVDGPTA